MGQPRHIGAGIDRGHAGHRQRRGSVDPPDQGMGVVAAAERDMQHPVALDVGDVVPRPGQQAGILAADDGRPDELRPCQADIVGRAHPASLRPAAARTAATMF